MEYNAAFHLGVCHFFFTMGTFGWDKRILLAFFCKTIWEIFLLSHVIDVYADQSPLFVLSTLIHKQLRLTKISVYIKVPFDHDDFIILHFSTSTVMSDQVSMYSLVSFFCSSIFFRKISKIRNLHHFVSISHLVFFWCSKR